MRLPYIRRLAPVNAGWHQVLCILGTTSFPSSESVSCEWLQPIVGRGENKGEPWKMADDGAIVVCHSQRPAHHQSGGTIHQDDRRPDRLLSHRTLHHSSPFLLSHSAAPQSHIYNPLDQLQLHQSSSSTILMVLHHSSPFLEWHSAAPQSYIYYQPNPLYLHQSTPSIVILCCRSTNAPHSHCMGSSNTMCFYFVCFSTMFPPSLLGKAGSS